MREIIFRITDDRPGHLEATAARPKLTVSAPSQEEWHHEAREELIRRLGPTHATYRIRLHRGSGTADASDPRRPRGGWAT
jgi:hypothetical protein